MPCTVKSQPAKAYLLGIVLLAWACVAAASPRDAAEGSLGLDYGVVLGGSDTLDKNISGGNPHTQDIVDAGTGEFFNLQLSHFLWNSPVGFEIAVGYIRGGDQPFCVLGLVGGNDPCKYDLQRMTGDLLLQYRLNDDSALTLGRTFHRNIILSSSADDNPFPNVDFGNAAGWILQYEHSLQPGLRWGARYTHIVYHTVNTYAFVNASSFGMFVGLDLPVD